MSSLGLPPQSVSHATFLPMTDEAKEVLPIKEVKVVGFVSPYLSLCTSADCRSSFESVGQPSLGWRFGPGGGSPDSLSRYGFVARWGN